MSAQLCISTSWVCYPPETQQVIFVLCGGHESETSKSCSICAISLRTRGHPSLFSDARVWPTGHFDFLINMASVTASSFYANKRGCRLHCRQFVVSNQIESKCSCLWLNINLVKSRICTAILILSKHNFYLNPCNVLYFVTQNVCACWFRLVSRLIDLVHQSDPS